MRAWAEGLDEPTITPDHPDLTQREAVVDASTSAEEPSRGVAAVGAPWQCRSHE